MQATTGEALATGVAPRPALAASLRPPPGVTRTWMPALQSLRGCAALAVVLYHAEVFMRGVQATPPDLAGVRMGWLGVDLFFVLSAYLLGQPFFRGPGPSQRAFIVDRFLRVAPAYYVALVFALAIIVSLDLPQGDVAGAALNVLFLQNFDEVAIFAVNPAFWTLAVEMQFYVLLPVLAKGFRGPRWGAALAVCIAIACGWRGAFYLMAEPTLATHALPAFLGHFGLGLAAARIGPLRNPVGSGVRRVTLLAGIPFLVLPVLLWIPAGSLAFGQESLVGTVLVRPLVAVGFTLIVLATASGGWPGRALAMRPLAWLGGISYSFYLMHLGVLPLLGLVVDPRSSPWLFLASYLLLSLGLGSGLYFAVEAPAERWRRRWKSSRQPATGAPVA